MNPSNTASSRLRVTVGQSCLAGTKDQNEDCTGVRIGAGEDLRTKGVAAVVADGVGAASGSKVASETCVQGFLSDYFSTPDSWTVKTSAQRVMDGLNRWLYGQGHAEGLSDEKGYVSTLSAMVLRSRTAFIFHIGDTRVYRMRDGVMEQLTRDHRSVVSRQTSYLNRAMGLNLSLKVDYKEVDLEVGDCFLLCSDGVHDWMTDDLISEVLLSSKGLEHTAAELTERALAAGSDDNVTSLLLRVDELPESDMEEAARILGERPFPPLLDPGMKLDGLEVEEILVESTRSQLYRVTDLENGRELVMKTPSSNYRDDKEYIARFVAEEWIGKRVSHKNLVQVVQRDRKPTFLYYLMESLDGKNLAQWLEDKKGKPAVEEVVGIVKQIVDAVRALHRKETLHQDLKLENVIISDQGKVCVIDYGSCSVAGLKESPSDKDEEVLGTLDFSAPEYRMPDSEKANTRADQFSIAMIAYHLLTGGKCPYGDKWEKADNLRDFHALEYIPSYRYQAMVPVWMDGALKKALRVSPSSRYPSMSEWMHDMGHPNPEFMESRHLPMMERDPVKFWKLISALLFVLVVILMVLGDF
ncbi:serine/threonine-protein kinase PknD [Rubritalea halochordaticola]|uniref:Serine/threonine-protein kinase PknD n=1 Tax=Rubritalea halochordaticola TaxID=714537 RepID=A0ABP9UX08_9BACT